MATNPDSNSGGQDGGGGGGGKSSSSSWSSSEPRLPLARVRQLARLDPDARVVAPDAVFALARATEMFIEMLAKVLREMLKLWSMLRLSVFLLLLFLLQKSAEATVQRNKKVVTRADLDRALKEDEEGKLHFLLGGVLLDREPAEILGGGPHATDRRQDDGRRN